jgi:sphingosine kinase
LNPFFGLPNVPWTLLVRTFVPISCAQPHLLIDTTHNKHATEIAKALSLEYDVLVTLGGDGIIHEVMNGFALHTQSAQAFDTPIAPIPTGSGNGTSLNLLGLEVRFV